MVKTTVQIDGLMVAIGLGLIVVGLVYVNQDKIKAAASSVGNAVNPNSPDNLVNRAVVGAVGQDKVSSAADYIFGAVDLINYINPWAHVFGVSKDSADLALAKQTYGITW